MGSASIANYRSRPTIAPPGAASAGSTVPRRHIQWGTAVTQPIYRYLRGYALDPGFSTRLDTVGINEVIYRVPYETLEPGPSGEYVDVIDFDPASRCWYEPVNLCSEEVASQHGLTPSEGNPQFHQQFVYAVVMKTVRHFERALGRKVIWFPRERRAPKDLPEDAPHPGFVQKLRIYPHALRDANAYYDPDKRALLFGYFTAADQTQGTNYPGGLVFTCLSPDIVAHETTHAILDSLHHRYIEDTNPDVAAFHEGFADIVALLQRFTFRELVEHQLFASDGRMDRYNVFGELATQFGEALEGNRGALRSMIGRWNERGRWEPLKPTSADYITQTEAHDRGAVLVATVFDAFQRVYAHRTADLVRIASNGTGVLQEGRISRDLVGRLAREASAIAEHLLHICIRALDYCPPMDITFGSYLRALITADLDIAPEDESGYRVALIEAFRARGIYPTRVNTLSVDSLRWEPTDFEPKEREMLGYIATNLKPDIRDLVDTVDRAQIDKFSRKAAARLHDLLLSERPVLTSIEWEAFLNKLGMTAKPAAELFKSLPEGVRGLTGRTSTINGLPPIEVHTVRPAFRAGREGRQIEQVLVTLTQRITVKLDDGSETVFRGGCSIIFSLGSLSNVEFVVRKDIRSRTRLERQVSYQQGEANAAAVHSSVYTDETSRNLNFNLLHRH